MLMSDDAGAWQPVGERTADDDLCSRFRPRLHGVSQRARIGADYRVGRHLFRVTVSVAYYSLVPAIGWTVDMVFRGLERRFVIHSVGHRLCL